LAAGAFDKDRSVTPARAILTAPTPTPTEPDEDESGSTTAPSVEERVEHICDLMADLQWERGKTGKKLAALWGLKLNTVERSAAEASRRMTADKDGTARDISIIARKAMISAHEVHDYKGIKAMGDLLLDVSGARAPTKVVSTNLEVAAEATPEEASRLVRESFGEHAALKAKPNAPNPGNLPEGPPKP
jgi:hypothetical protein